MPTPPALHFSPALTLLGKVGPLGGGKGDTACGRLGTPITKGWWDPMGTIMYVWGALDPQAQHTNSVLPLTGHFNLEPMLASASRTYLFVETKPEVLSATVCLPVEAVTNEETSIEQWLLQPCTFGQWEAVFRTILTAFKDSTEDKTLLPSDLQDILKASKRHLAGPISLLLEPDAKQAKLNLIKTKVEEQYPKLQLPTAKALEPMSPANMKAAFTALTGEMKVEELDLFSVDLQLAAIKLIISLSGKLKSQPPALARAKQDKVIQLFNYFSPDLSKLSARIHTGIIATPGDMLLDRMTKLKSTLVPISGLSDFNSLSINHPAKAGGTDSGVSFKSSTRKSRYDSHEAALVMKSCRYAVLEIFTCGKISVDPMILSAIPLWTSFEGEGSMDGFRYKLQTGLNNVVETIRQEAATNISTEGQALAQTCIQDTKTFTLGLIQWMKTDGMSPTVSKTYLSTFTRPQRLELSWEWTNGFSNHLVVLTVLNKHMSHQAVMQDELNTLLEVLKRGHDDVMKELLSLKSRVDNKTPKKAQSDFKNLSHLALVHGVAGKYLMAQQSVQRPWPWTRIFAVDKVRHSRRAHYGPSSVTSTLHDGIVPPGWKSGSTCFSHGKLGGITDGWFLILFSRAHNNNYVAESKPQQSNSSKGWLKGSRKRTRISLPHLNCKGMWVSRHLTVKELGDVLNFLSGRVKRIHNECDKILAKAVWFLGMQQQDGARTLLAGPKGRRMQMKKSESGTGCMSSCYGIHQQRTSLEGRHQRVNMCGKHTKAGYPDLEAKSEKNGKSPVGKIHHKTLKLCVGFLVYVAMKYIHMIPYLKGLYITLNSWRTHQDARGWTIPPLDETRSPFCMMEITPFGCPWEAANLVESLKRMVGSGTILRGTEVLLFMNNFVAESTMYKGSSSSKLLHNMILRKMAMNSNVIIHFVWISYGGQMIWQGTDGLSRGDFTNGVMAGEAFLKFIPLHLSAFDRHPLGQLTWKFTSPGDWFHTVFTDPEGAWVAAHLPPLMTFDRVSHSHDGGLEKATFQGSRCPDHLCKLIINMSLEEGEDLMCGLVAMCSASVTKKKIFQFSGIVCANFGSRTNAGILMCYGVWRPECFSQAPGDQFPILRPSLRDGDHLMTPFQCKYCWSFNLKGHAQCAGCPTGDLLARCIWRATLDAFWSRERSTVAKDCRELACYFDCQVHMGTDLSCLPAQGPLQQEDCWGMKVACAMLLRSLDPGRNAPFVQFETVRKCHSAFTNYVHTCPEGVGAHLTLQGIGRDFVSTLVANSLWINCFTTGCHRHMGDVVWLPDAPVTLEIMDTTLDYMEEKWDDIDTWRENFDFAPWAYWDQSTSIGKMDGAHCVPLALSGSFKNQTLLQLFTHPLAPKTKKGRNILGWWFQRMKDFGKMENIKSGSLFMNEEQNWCATIADLDRPFHDILEVVQCHHASIIDSSVVVEDAYRAYRLFRRGATSAAKNGRLDASTINANNHGRTQTSRNRSKPNSMFHHYTTANAIIPTFIRFSYEIGTDAYFEETASFQRFLTSEAVWDPPIILQRNSEDGAPLHLLQGIARGLSKLLRQLLVGYVYIQIPTADQLEVKEGQQHICSVKSQGFSAGDGLLGYVPTGDARGTFHRTWHITPCHLCCDEFEEDERVCMLLDTVYNSLKYKRHKPDVVIVAMPSTYDSMPGCGKTRHTKPVAVQKPALLPATGPNANSGSHATTKGQETTGICNNSERKHRGTAGECKHFIGNYNVHTGNLAHSENINRASEYKEITGGVLLPLEYVSHDVLPLQDKKTKTVYASRALRMMKLPYMNKEVRFNLVTQNWAKRKD
eukprot:jgi/Psemu1/36047/gm1.36047_g